MDTLKAVEAFPPTKPTSAKASNIQIYYALPHATLSSAVNIVNLNPYLDNFIPVTRADLEADPRGTIPESLGVLQKEAKTLLKDKAPTPWLTCTKKGFLSSHYVVSSHAAAALAEMKISAWWGSSTITFNSSSVAASFDDDVAPPRVAAQDKPEARQAPKLPITVEDTHWYSREMTFVIDSVLYKWGMDSNWHSRRFTLYKGVSAKSRSKDEPHEGEICGKCLIGWSSWTSATIVVDAEKIDPLIVILTALPVLFRIKTTRQVYEWNAGSYGGP